MSCQRSGLKISRLGGINCGLSTLSSQSSYLTGVLAGTGGLLAGTLVYTRQKRAETALNKSVVEVLAQIRLASGTAFQATLQAASDFEETHRQLDRARALIKALPGHSTYVEVIRNELRDRVARVKAGIDLFEQGRVAQDAILRAQLLGRASSLFLDGQDARLGSFLARPSLAARDAALAGGATALTVAGGLWLWQQTASRRPGQAPVTWRPDRPAGAEVETASQVDPTRQIKVRYRAVELSEPITSHTIRGTINPEFEPALQPRRRDRVASKVQIERMAKNLEAPALLKSEANWSEGPPIVGPDGMIESGNGRMLALRQAAEAQPDRYAGYRRHLLERAPAFGLTRPQLEKMKQPVLVRERLTVMSGEERLRFVNEANASGLARLSLAEQAQADAARLPAGFFAGLQVAESDRSLAEVLLKQANRPVITRFLKLLPETEQTALVDRRGHLSTAGLDRLQRALFTYALPGPAGERLTRLVFEEGEAIERVGAGLKRALPHLGRMEDLIRAGQRDPKFSLGPDLAVAVEKMRDLRQQGLAVDDYVRQYNMFRDLTPFQQQWLVQLNRRRRSAKAVATLINTYAEAVLETAPPQQTRMFGATAETSPEKLLRAALKQVTGEWIELSKTSVPQREGVRPPLAGRQGGRMSAAPVVSRESR